MIRYFVLLLSLALMSVGAQADTLKSEAEAKQLAGKIMEKVGKGDLAEAFAVMKPYVVFPDSELQEKVFQTKSQRDQFGARYGKTVGFEFIREKKAGESILRLTYVEKTDRHALPWMFVFYKAPNGWVLNSFAWSDQILSAFE